MRIHTALPEQSWRKLLLGMTWSESTILRSLIVVFAPLIVFSIFLLIVGVNPLEAYLIMFRSISTDLYGLGEVFVKATPFILTALAAALPARAGLINVGGEGQLAIGALFTTWVAIFYIPNFPGIIGIPILLVAGMLGGACWSGLTGFLKVKGNMNETITSLLLNYVAVFTLGYFTHGLLKDPNSFNWPFSPPLSASLRLPTLLSSRVTIGILIAMAAAVIIWYIITKTRVGFGIRVIGGNAEAAKHAGFNVNKMHLWVLIAAGALAGLAGAIEITGIEERLRETTGAGYGYLGFLASWMAWNHPLRLVGTALILGLITVTGSALEINTGLPSSSVEILMALVLFAILAVGRRRTV